LPGNFLQARPVIEQSFVDAMHQQMGNAMRLVDRRLARRQFRPAPQARAERRLFRRLGVREKAAVLLLGHLGGANRPAVDSGGRNADEKHPVKTRIVGGQGLVFGVSVSHGL